MAQVADKVIRTPAGDAPLIPVLLMAGGAYLCWFGIHYWRSDTAWPSDPIKAVLRGQPTPEPDYSAEEQAIQNLAAVSRAGAVAGQAASAVSGAQAGVGTVTGSVMTKDQIKALWIGNGGNPATANVAAAVALAESSGRTGPDVNTHNPDGGVNVGLWQLDTKGVGAGHTIDQLQDPATNCRITIMGSANGTNWSHWEAYTSGAYKKYL